MNKREILSKIVKVSKAYDEILCGREILFIFGNKNAPEYAITSFRGESFQHLIGVEIDKEKLSSLRFYTLCIQNLLSESDFRVKNTTVQKLSAINHLINIEKTAKMTGEYNESAGFKLYTERLVGGQAASIGFVKTEDKYIPNTVLQEDVRKMVIGSPKRILVIAKKSEDAVYFNVSYIAKGLTIQDINIKGNLKDLFSHNLFKDDEKHKEEVPEKLKDGFVPTDGSEFYDRLLMPRSRSASRSRPDDLDM